MKCHSIQERLDFSCALFGPDGGLIANAPHIPVHLGKSGTLAGFPILKECHLRWDAVCRALSNRSSWYGFNPQWRRHSIKSPTSWRKSSA